MSRIFTVPCRSSLPSPSRLRAWKCRIAWRRGPNRWRLERHRQVAQIHLPQDALDGGRRELRDVFEGEHFWRKAWTSRGSVPRGPSARGAHAASRALRMVAVALIPPGRTERVGRLGACLAEHSSTTRSTVATGVAPGLPSAQRSAREYRSQQPSTSRPLGGQATHRQSHRLRRSNRSTFAICEASSRRS